MIKFDNVSIQYSKEFFTLLNFNFEISSNTLFVGDFYNGAISIMRIISKIDKEYSGKCTIDNIDIRNIKDKDLDLCYLPSTPVLIENKSTFKNLYFPLKIRKINKNTAKNQINSLKNELNSNFFEKKIKKLNLTERKIVALMRAVLRKPKILLLENFFENFDETYLEIANTLLNKLIQNSLIVACEGKAPNNNFFKTFQIVNLAK